MSGDVVYTAPKRPEPHRCEPPMTPSGWKDPQYPVIPEPTVPPGSIWRCECGWHWTATETYWRLSKRRELRRVNRQFCGLVQVLAMEPTPVPCPVDDEHPPADFDG